MFDLRMPLKCIFSHSEALSRVGPDFAIHFLRRCAMTGAMSDVPTADLLAAQPLAFTRFPLDRADHLRCDAEALKRLRARNDARVAPFWRGKPFAITRGDRKEPAFARADAFAADDAVLWVFLGLDGEAPTFAAALDPAREPGPEFPLHGLGEFVDMRGLAMSANAVEGSLLATANGVFAWHHKHGFCAACGAATNVAQGGWRRLCPQCGTEHFPRIDPVVIMLITHGDAILLGRSPAWPENAYSCLAGFMEPGETLGAAARREAREEAGVDLGDVQYLMSQPWPFPSSLMLGVRAEARSNAIAVDGAELADARWFARDDVRAIMAGAHPLARKPFNIAVAHHLLLWWLENG